MEMNVTLTSLKELSLLKGGRQYKGCLKKNGNCSLFRTVIVPYLGHRWVFYEEMGDNLFYKILEHTC